MYYICQASAPTRSVQTPVPHTFGLPHLSISVSPNLLLTLVIIIRLVLHIRNIRVAMGTAGIGGLCKSIVTMLMSLVPLTQWARCCLLDCGLVETQLRVSSAVGVLKASRPYAQDTPTVCPCTLRYSRDDQYRAAIGVPSWRTCRGSFDSPIRVRIRIRISL